MKKFSFALLLLAGVAAAAVEVPVDFQDLKVVFDTTGGGISSIVRKNKNFTIKAGSFTERVIGDTVKNGKPGQMQERFDKLQFEARFVKRYWMENEIEFSARGTGAFDWLRITKVYNVFRKKDYITVKYTLTNLDTKPHNVALWTRTFLRADEDGKNANVYLQPGAKSVSNLLHPGPSVRGDEWNVAPAKAWSAVYDPRTNRGAIVTFPGEKPAAFYNWFSLKEVLGTLEFITGEKVLEPGKSTTFTANIHFSDNVPAELKKAAYTKLDRVKPAAKCGNAPTYFSSGRERELATYQNLGGSLPRSADSMNLSVVRQYTTSVREVILPEKVSPDSVAVFEVANKRADYSKEVPSKVFKGADGKYRLLFAVPGVEGNFYSNKIAADGSFRNSRKEYYGKANFDVEIAFDRKGTKTLDMKGFDKGANLIYNGFFTVPHPKLKNLPDGYPDNFYSDRILWYGWKEGVLTVTRPEAKHKWVGFGPYVVLEKDMKYTVSVKVRNDNRIKGTSIGTITFYDAAGKDISTARLRFYPGNTDAHEWRTITKEFYTPANARYARISFMVYGIKEQTLYFDDLQVIPQPYSAVQVKLVDRLRDQLKNSWYKPIDYIERNLHDEVTPHVKWMKNSAVKMPEVLFLPICNGNYTTLERRFIVEMLQRMDFTYKMIPLLRHVSYINGSGIMGVYRNTFENRLEPYTIERLKEIKKFPKVVVLKSVNFKECGKELPEFLKKALKDKSKFFFVDCENIPAALLGKAKTTPEELFLLPRVKNPTKTNLLKWLAFYENGATYSTGSKYLYGNPMVYLVDQGNTYPDYLGRDYPFMEYTYLGAVRVLRYLAGAVPAAKILSARQVNNEALLKTTALPAGTLLKSGYRWGNEFFALPDLKVSGSEIKVSLAALPAKFSVFEYTLTDAKGQVLDAGALAVNKPDVLKLAIKGDRKSFRYGKEIKLAVTAANIPAGMEMQVKIEDNDRRVVWQGRSSGKELAINFKPAAPVAAFYRIIACVGNAKSVPARELGEFTITGLPRDPAELLTVMWPAANSAKYGHYRRYGYDQLIVWCVNNTPALRALRSAGIEPVIYGQGTSSFDNWKPYKDDKATDDPVRKPCFSDAKVMAQGAKKIHDRMTSHRLDYYGVTCQLIGDEQYIGSTVCFSEHCVKQFREVLKKEFKDLAALNASWGTGFKSWDEVTPVQSKEITDRSKLGRWLDHKIFMNNVFAHTYIGGVRKAMQKVIPETLTGLSGTYNPGPTYEWSQIMKQVDYVAYYSGIQRKLAQDLGKPGLFGGQWYGGYVAPVPSDGYVSSHFWRGFLIGANLSPIYAPRAGITGDLKLTPVLQTYDRILKESRKGFGKLILSSKESPRIAMLYSQRSLFACTGTIGANEWQNAITGWHTMLGDLGMDYRIVDKEILETRGIGNEFKVLILPAAIALSDKEIAQIEAFVKAGNTVIADMTPGIYDEHGALRKNAAFAARFGGAASVPELVQVKIDYKGNSAGIPAVKGDFRTTAGTDKFFHVSAFGKGRFIGINLLLSGYQTVTLGGIGGEVAEASSGAAAFCNAWRSFAKGALVKAGVNPHREIRNAKNQATFAESCWRSNGDNHVLGLLRFDTKVPVIDRKKGEKLTVKIPVKGHVYDLRNCKYLGNTDTINVFLTPARGEFFSVMKEQVTKVQLTLPKSVKAGSEFKFAAKALTKSGKSAGKVVFHYEFKAPSGKVYDRYCGNLLSDEKGCVEKSLQSAFNDEKGSWTLSVSCANSGTAANAQFTLN